jgi:hypothetical protein
LKAVLTGFVVGSYLAKILSVHSLFSLLNVFLIFMIFSFIFSFSNSMVEIEYYKINCLDLKLEIEMRIFKCFQGHFWKNIIIYVSKTCPVCNFFRGT